MTMATTFNLSPLIRITLLSLYVSLTVPIPFLADVTQAPVSPALLWVGLGLGAIFLYGALSEKVCLDETGITVTYPVWFRWLTRKGWSLPWENIAQLKMRTTGQGGLVYYFVTPERDRAYLLPMRVAGFAKMVGLIEAQTNIDTSDVRPLSQPWMYMILLGFSVLLFLVDGWAIATAMTLS
ncbi:hypothetical protein AWQ21_13135 [Picosynechococcus sp. PCC 7003]|uniref:hypothetical protein n=1 Tax=Picosynechococcus sp. PCC 7003 TaxID=374981 RepID=UPI0008105BCB|nr:hypothetical protein [Picosynechococcus sp. PCC 7003]ANV85235.1 hypothetical protein AWQ21_13135 [Picosynechococcus sp. PCC 7003]